MIDIDYSFLRLRDNFDDAKNLSDSPQVDDTLAQYTQVHLCPNEAYLQISNSPTAIVFNDNYEVWLVDECNNELEEVTNRVFIEERIDTNGLKQIAWEYINTAEYYYKPLSLRFTNTTDSENLIYWWTNLFISTEYNSELTTRIDYKSSDYHYGTQYNRLDFRQSIRLSMYFRNKVNESERSEYHEISTDRTVPQRNIKKFKERYILDRFNTWTIERLELLLSSSSIYLDGVRSYSTNPLEFLEPELDSNFAEGEMIVSKNYLDTYTFTYEIFDGLVLNNYNPFGLYVTGYEIEALSVDANIPIQLNTGTLSVYNSSGNLVHSFNENDMVINSDIQLKVISTGTPIQFLPNDTYYVNMTANLISGFGIPSPEINDTTTWTFTLQNGQFNKLQFNNAQFLTN